MSSLRMTDIPIANGSGGAGRSTIASYDDYQKAQRAVDGLSDAGFPVQTVEIVGRDLRFVERVTGRLTTWRAAMTAAAAGAWFGLFIGLLVGLFTTGAEWLGLVLGGLVIGAFWGAVYGFVTHWATRGLRDFGSLRALAAGQYDVMVVASESQRAQAILADVQPSAAQASR